MAPFGWGSQIEPIGPFQWEPEQTESVLRTPGTRVILGANIFACEISPSVLSLLKNLFSPHDCKFSVGRDDMLLNVKSFFDSQYIVLHASVQSMLMGCNGMFFEPGVEFT